MSSVPGPLTTVQDLPGRLGYWHVGVPPSGPFDPCLFGEANLAVGNPVGAPGLEVTAGGLTARFSAPSVVCITGAPVSVTLDGEPVGRWEPVDIPAGGTLALGPSTGPGLRAYIAVRGGIDVPSYLGSASTFTLGGFGGHAGRALLAGDVLRTRSADSAENTTGLGRIAGPTPTDRRPAIGSQLADRRRRGAARGAGVLHPRRHRRAVSPPTTRCTTTPRAPASASSGRSRRGRAATAAKPVFTRPTSTTPPMRSARWTSPVTLRSSWDRTARLWAASSARPSWPAANCGSSGSCGPATPSGSSLFARRTPPVSTPPVLGRRCARAGGDGDDGVLGRLEISDDRPAVTYRRDGDTNVLVEYGPMELDLALRMRVHALQETLAAHAPAGIIDVTPGIRSLQIHTDPSVLRPRHLTALLKELEREVPPTHELVVPSRAVRLPLSWDDPATRLAIERYMAGVRDDAPWCPWNIEFIRRINGLESARRRLPDRVRRRAISCWVSATSIWAPRSPRRWIRGIAWSPRSTTPPARGPPRTRSASAARTCASTAWRGQADISSSAARCRSGTVSARAGCFSENPWALRFFDRIEWYPVTADELLELRAETDAGRGSFDTEDGAFSLAEYMAFLRERRLDRGVPHPQSAAFEAEKQRWRRSGEFDRARRAEPVAAQRFASRRSGSGDGAVHGDGLADRRGSRLRG